MAFCFFDVIPGPPQAEPGIQRLGGNGFPRALFARAVQTLAGLPSVSRLGAARRPEGCAVRDDIKSNAGRPG